jgi:hypothetical protein
MNSEIHTPSNSLKLQHKDNVKIDILNEWKETFTKRIKNECNSTKQTFSYIDATSKKHLHTKRDLCFIETNRFLSTNPLRNNDYSKYVSCYIEEGKKLNLKYFRNNIPKLNEYYKKVDEAKATGIKRNPFNFKAYQRYVLFMSLKFSGEYTSDLDEAFNVKITGNRTYNPLTNIPSVLRGELPFEVMELDIYREFPTIIDEILGTNYRHTIYEVLDKKTFAYLLNSNITNEGANYEKTIKELSRVYGDENARKVLTPEMFNNKGRAFEYYSSFEKGYINNCVEYNGFINYVQLHDGIFLKKDTEIKNTTFGIVEFKIKECIKPPIENETLNFYSIDGYGNVNTSRTIYADFFKQEKFKRISTPDDKIQLLVDTNNVIEFFNHKTNIVSFLESNINESSISSNAVREVIAKESNSLIYQSYTLIPPSEMVYYSDPKNGFGLPFKNGFFYYDNGEIKQKKYTDVNGFFAPHNIQNREFKYTNEVGMFERFLTRASTGREVANSSDTINIYNSFKAMFGYLIHTYKSQTNSPCIILTDEGANDDNRNGRRGKSLLSKGIAEIQTQLFKGGNEFDPNYTFVFDDLEKKHKSYVIDDVPAGFKYESLYTNILGNINCHRKGKTAETIPFEETPKFLITTNWVVRYDEKNTSTNARFLEYKFSDYYKPTFSPQDEFKCSFFEDWNSEEWDRFYSFSFRCVNEYFKNGISQIPYNKTTDNYLASFNNTSMLDEFERIINTLLDCRNEFVVNDFLAIYDAYDNPMRIQRFFTHKNIKRLIDVWFSKNSNINWSYYSRYRKWIKKT